MKGHCVFCSCSLLSSVRRCNATVPFVLAACAEMLAFLCHGSRLRRHANLLHAAAGSHDKSINGIASPVGRQGARTEAAMGMKPLRFPLIPLDEIDATYSNLTNPFT